MTIAISGTPIEVIKGKMRVTCVGGTSLMEINQDNTGWVKASGGDIVEGVIPDGAIFITDELGDLGGDSETLVKFTGTGTISYIRTK